MTVVDKIREFWDADAATYDLDPGHHPAGNMIRAVWRSALEGLLPPAPSQVLDVGSGTGFLSLLACELGHAVTAVDLSPRMLGRLRQKADSAGLQVKTVEADAVDVPPGPFDAVMSRHLLWTLLDPATALGAWRRAAPLGRLVLIDRDWGDPSAAQQLRGRCRQLVDRVRSTPPTHHSTYDPEIVGALPLGHGARPEAVLDLVAKAGWASPRLGRLRDIDWAMAQQQPWLDRIVQGAPHFAVLASAPTESVGTEIPDLGSPFR
ncbi:MAG: class I SAM-dependent methyltransferase [Candidatus Dormibacteria bacterium]